MCRFSKLHVLFCYFCNLYVLSLYPVSWCFVTSDLVCVDFVSCLCDVYLLLLLICVAFASCHFYLLLPPFLVCVPSVSCVMLTYFCYLFVLPLYPACAMFCYFCFLDVMSLYHFYMIFTNICCFYDRIILNSILSIASVPCTCLSIHVCGLKVFMPVGYLIF